METLIIAPAADTRFFGHPRGLATLFFTEMWERFSYYGMRALLILFMTTSVAEGGLGFEVAKAGVIYGLYTGMVYMAALPGGWLADRFLGLRRAVLYGGVIIACGHYVLAIPSVYAFYTGLALIVTGTGLLKPNISTIVGQLYSEKDVRRDAGFSLFYMGINIGAFIAPLICGYVGQRINWHYGFGLAGVGMTLGVIQYTFGWKNLGDAGPHPAKPGDARQLRLALMVFAAIVVAVAVLGALGIISAKGVAEGSGVLLLFVVLAFFGWMFSSANWTPVERKRLIAVAVLFTASVIFFSVFEQAGSTLNLFAQRSTLNRVLGYDFPASWYQSINSLFVISLAPVLAWLWIRLGRSNPSYPSKFAMGLLFVSLGFALLVWPAMRAIAGAKVSPIWLILTYLCHSIGELCLSPVGLSAMTKLAPARVAGLVMGVWFLSLSVGNYIGGQIASLYEAFSLPALFGVVAAFAAGAAIILSLVTKPTVRLMSGVE